MDETVEVCSTIDEALDKVSHDQTGKRINVDSTFNSQREITNLVDRTKGGRDYFEVAFAVQDQHRPTYRGGVIINCRNGRVKGYTATFHDVIDDTLLVLEASLKQSIKFFRHIGLLNGNGSLYFTVGKEKE